MGQTGKIMTIILQYGCCNVMKLHLIYIYIKTFCLRTPGKMEKKITSPTPENDVFQYVVCECVSESGET